MVPVNDIRDNKYDLSINRYKEIIHEVVEYESPEVILDELAALEDEDYQSIIRAPRMFSISGGDGLRSTLETWFAGDSAPRKQKILGISENCEGAPE
jgi:hypothetical protein